MTTTTTSGPRGGRGRAPGRRAARHAIAVLVAVAAVAIVAAGCLRADVAVQVDDDGTARVRLEVLPADVLADAAGVGGGVELPGLARALVAGRSGVTVEDLPAGGVAVVVEVADVDELAAVLTTPQAELGAAPPPFRSFDVVRVGIGDGSGSPGGWRLRAVPDVVRSLDAVTGLLGNDGLRGTFDALTGAPEVRLSVQLPGRVVAANTDDVDGGTATWVLTGPDAAAELRLDTEPAAPPWWFWAVAVGGLLASTALVGVAVRSRSRRRALRAAVAHPAPVAPPPGGFGPPPAPTAPVLPPGPPPQHREGTTP